MATKTHKLSGSVGIGGKNFPTDVEEVQKLLTKQKLYAKKIDGRCGSGTINGIKKFQAKFMKVPDALIEPKGRTWKYLTGERAIAAPKPSVAPSNLTTSPVTGNPNINGQWYFPLARLPAVGRRWTDDIRQFGWRRKERATGTWTRSHAGCDLYADEGADIYAMTYGIVIQAPRHFNLETECVVIKHSSFIALYGEIRAGSCTLREGEKVNAGQKIAQVGRMPGIANPMLHLEMYDGSANDVFLTVNERDRETKKGRIVNGRATYRRKDLIDPTPYLNSCANNLPTAYEN